MKNDFIIPLNGLPVGKADYAWHAGKEFFGSFGDSEILDADVDVDAHVEKSGDGLGLDCKIKGRLTVPCDRCLEPLDLPVDKTWILNVKFGEEPDEGEVIELDGDDEKETVYFPSGSARIDLSQVVYDYTVLSLPAKRVHPDGQCNPEVMRFLTEDPGVDTEPAEDGKPFDALKGLFGEDKGE